MIVVGLVLLTTIFLYLALELMLYWAPLLAVWWRPHKTAPPVSLGQQPVFCIASACRDGAACIEGLVKTMRDQDYPQDKIRLYLVADNCIDNSAELARSLGMDVLERQDLQTSGKGKAINELLDQRLRHEAFDILIVFDIDARVEPLFLKRAAKYFGDKPMVLSCATFAKNPEETLLTHVGTLIQALLRLHQSGRAALGLDAILYGSHGYALTRGALDRLGWRTTTGQIAEDMELRLRCTLQGLPIRYGPDLAVYNDVTGDPADVREQRRRWNSTYLPLIPHYVGPLLKRWLTGDWRCLETLFGLLLLPAFANLFLFLTMMLIVMGTLAFFYPLIQFYAEITAGLWLLDVAYFFAAFRLLGIPLRSRDLKGFMVHLRIRAVALVESVFFVHVKIWAPAPHKED